MNIVSTMDVDGDLVNIVDVEHCLILRSSGSPALSKQDFSVDEYPWIICLQKLSVFMSLPLCNYLCVFASLHFCLCVFALSIDQFPWASFMRPSQLPQSQVFPNCYGVRTRDGHGVVDSCGYAHMRLRFSA